MRRSNLVRRPTTAPRRASAATAISGRWKLQDAKARFSEVVRAARTQGPQHVTVHGREAVVVISADEYARLAPLAAQPSLHAFLSQSPLRGLDFERESVRVPVRDVAL